MRSNRVSFRWACMLTLAVLALLVLIFSRRLIVPFPVNVPWYESPVMFPALGLALLLVGACAQGFSRRELGEVAKGEELDSTAADLGRAARVVLLFVAYALVTPWLGFATSSLAFVIATGRVTGLPWTTCVALGVPLAVGMWLLFVVLLKLSFGHGILV